MGSKAKNKVISGYLAGANITHFWGEIKISGFAGNQTISKATVANIELVNSETNKDTGSSIARGVVGGVLLGPAGLIGGALLGKHNDIYTLSINFKNGKKSLVEIDSNLYKELTIKLY